MNRALSVICAALVVTACSEFTGPRDVPADAVELAMQPLVAPTSWSGFKDRERIVVADAEQWEEIWLRYAHIYIPVPTRPSVDFTRSLVIVAAMGERSNGGYGIEVEGVYSDSETLFVVVQESAPGGGPCVQHNAVNNPVNIVVVPRSDRRVRFVERSRTNRC